jgi:predicted branched-subunit amino acid permease
MSRLERIRRQIDHPEYRRGARDMAALGVGIGAWGLVTGVAMVKGGLSVPVALLMTYVVFAGSAQLASVPLIASGAPLWVMWATAACVNLRFLIFSAQWRPFLLHLPPAQRLAHGFFAADITYVLFMRRYASPDDLPRQLAYFRGLATVNSLSWLLPSTLGILLADVIPTAWGLGFAGTIALVGLSYSLVTDRATALAAGVAGTAAVAAFALPFKLHIVVAIAAAVAIGLIIDGGGEGRGIRRLGAAGEALRQGIEPLRRRLGRMVRA